MKLQPRYQPELSCLPAESFTTLFLRLLWSAALGWSPYHTQSPWRFDVHAARTKQASSRVLTTNGSYKDANKRHFANTRLFSYAMPMALQLDAATSSPCCDLRRVMAHLHKLAGTKLASSDVLKKRHCSWGFAQTTCKQSTLLICNAHGASMLMPQLQVPAVIFAT